MREEESKITQVICPVELRDAKQSGKGWGVGGNRFKGPKFLYWIGLFEMPIGLLTEYVN